MLKDLARNDLKADKPKRRGGKSKNAPNFNARTQLMQMCGIDVTTAFKVVAEIGADLSRFKDAKHFASWLGLYPGTKISGGKKISAATSHHQPCCTNAENSGGNLRASQSALGAYYRRLCGRMDKAKAVTLCP